MNSFQFSLLRPKTNKTKAKNTSEKLPRLRLRFGPKTPLYSPYDTLKSFSPREQTYLTSLSPPHSPSISPTFVDSLTFRFEQPSQNGVTLMPKLIDPINVYWSIINTRGFIPDARTGASMSILSRSIYIFGGEKSDQSSDIKKLNYRNLNWEKIPSTNSTLSEVPTIKTGHTAVTYKNNIVIYGGFSSFDSNLQIRNCISLVYFFDTITYIWKSHKPTGVIPEARRNHTSALVGCSMIVYSGVDSKGNLVPGISVLNLESMHWTSFKLKGEIPAPRKACTLTSVFNNNILEHFHFDLFTVPRSYDHIFTKQTSGVYMFGGMNEEGAALNDIYVLKGQPSKAKPGLMEVVWTRIMPAGKLPIGRYGHSASLCGGFLIVVGGRNDSVVGGIVEDVAILRVAGWRWESVKCYGDVPNARIGASTATIGSKLMLLGGMYLSGFASSALYELESDQKRVTEMINLRRQV